VVPQDALVLILKAAALLIVKYVQHLTTTEEPALAIRTSHLSKRYQSGQNTITIFENLDLSVRAGERLALTGESGAGKSTLLHLLGGLDRPTEGCIHYGEVELTGMSEAGMADFRNRHVGFVWQTHYLLPEFTALENVMMPLLIRGVARAQASGEARERWTRSGSRQERTTAPGSCPVENNSAL